MNRLFIKLLRFLFDLAGPLIGPGRLNIKTEKILIEKDFELVIYTPTLLERKNVILYFHGGGWIIGSIKAYDNILRYLCSKTNSIVIGVGYRKAPEYKHPTAVEDSYTAYLWVLEHIAQNDQNVKISLVGDSAGGNLVVNLINIIKQTKYIEPNLAVLIYPAIGITNNSLDKLKKLKPKWLNFLGYYFIRYCLKNYLKDFDKIDSLDDYQSNYDEFIDHKLPKIFILMAHYDPLSELIIQWRNKQHNKQNITCISYLRTIHGFINFTRFSRQAQLALDKVISCLQEGP